ncbi:DNA-binding protein [Hornefia butyriciproducens]|uniref:DNA-binding protein n=1 Tax=Hornefia butyriciproducens TaxID=2652293 RepID=UPI0027018E80|nr:DNA-binding protein [Bacillota bacterium]
MDYITTHEAAEKWGITRRRVSKLCQEGRIQGAVLMGKTWILPARAEKPEDHRLREIRNQTTQSEEHI